MAIDPLILRDFLLRHGRPAPEQAELGFAIYDWLYRIKSPEELAQFYAWCSRSPPLSVELDQSDNDWFRSLVNTSLLPTHRASVEAASSLVRDYLEQSSRGRSSAQRRLEVLARVVGTRTLVERLGELCPYTPERRPWVLRLVADDHHNVRLSDYGRLFQAIDDLYCALLSVSKPEYFVSHWLEGKPLAIGPEDALIVEAITKNSPETLSGTGVAVGLKALGDALSIGKQYTEIRTATVKIEEAKLELRHKQDVYEREERQARAKEQKLEAELCLDLERKRQEVEAARQNLRQTELNLVKAEQENAFRTVQILSECIKLLKEVPDGLRDEFQNDILLPITRRITSSPLSLESFRADEPAEGTAAD